ncbi:MAG: UbiA family prenyltransferase [Planctomycetes bacterium]|jgi:4-hydroxybenzoate polyprenyltransferase|nr:UbiA family prenyltransferase [Planctomycetota bacterium]
MKAVRWTETTLVACGHLALWAGLYAGGCVLFVEVVVGEPLRWRPIGIAALLTMGTYLLDRVGPWPSMPDRGDMASVPHRVRFLRRQVYGVRWLAMALLVAALVMALAEGIFAAITVPAAVVGMMGYAHVPGQRRLKDRLLIKNASVAMSMTALAAVLVVFPRWPQSWAAIQWTPLVIALAAVFLHVLAGAMLCDLDDARSDARQGTRTLPNTIGPLKTWWCAEAATVLAGGFLLGGVAFAVVPAGIGITLAGLPVAGVILLKASGAQRIRDLVDIMFPLAVVASVLLAQ